MSNLRSIFIGNFSLSQQKVYSLKNYTQFYDELISHPETAEVDVFAGYFLAGDPGFDFSFEQQLSDKINFTLSRGNSSTTRLLPFVWNNIMLFARLTFFCLKKGNYFVFLPSAVGVWSILILALFKRHRNLGIYIGGYYGKEQLFEKRQGNIKKTLKKLTALLVDKLVLYAIKKSDYVVTSSYEYYHFYKATGKIFLAPPMLNVEENDMDMRPSNERDKCLTFCGELRHAKGVIDLLNAFCQLVKEGKIPGYKLKIIGTGQAYEELVHLAKTNGISDLVIFCGQIKQRDKLKEELVNSTVFVLPSYSEGFPRVAYECFALGVPAILTPVGGIPFLVKDREHCLFAEPGNVNDLASKIFTLLSDANLRSQMVAHSKRLMKQEIFPRIKTHGSLAKMIIKNMNTGTHTKLVSLASPLKAANKYPF